MLSFPRVEFTIPPLRASLYYSINNQLRLIFAPTLTSLYSENIIIRNGSHFKRQWDEWWCRPVFWGSTAATAASESATQSFYLISEHAIECGWSENHWNRIGNAFCVVIGNNNNRQSSSSLPMTLWIANLISFGFGAEFCLWSHESISFIPHVLMFRCAEKESGREKKGARMRWKIASGKIGSLLIIEIQFSFADDSRWWFLNNLQLLKFTDVSMITILQ